MVVPRILGDVFTYPPFLLEAGANEAFLMQIVATLEAEREAARENPDERKVRLEEAFAKERMVWVRRRHFVRHSSNRCTSSNHD